MKPNPIETLLAASAFFPLGPDLPVAGPDSPCDEARREATLTQAPVEIRSACAGDLSLNAASEARAKVPRYDAARVDDSAYSDDLHRGYRQEPYTTLLAADNTRTNCRDREGTPLTPLDQGNSSVEVDVTSWIRKAILAGENLSVNAQNVKIIARDGLVTLRGPVRNASEKTSSSKLRRAKPAHSCAWIIAARWPANQPVSFPFPVLA